MNKEPSDLAVLNSVRLRIENNLRYIDHNLHTLRTGLEEDALDKPTMLRLVENCEKYLKEITG